MVSAIGAALVGLQRADTKVTTAADNISKINTTEAPTQEPTKDIVDLSIGAREFEANLQAIKVQQKMDQALFDILA